MKRGIRYTWSTTMHTPWKEEWKIVLGQKSQANYKNCLFPYRKRSYKENALFISLHPCTKLSVVTNPWNTIYTRVKSRKSLKLQICPKSLHIYTYPPWSFAHKSLWALLRAYSDRLKPFFNISLYIWGSAGYNEEETKHLDTLR